MDPQASVSNKRQGSNTKKRSTPINLSTTNKEDSSVNTQSPTKKRRKTEAQVFTDSDAYCWLCHREGKVIKCAACPRVYHTRCLGSEVIVGEDWVCAECERAICGENVDTRSKAMQMITLDQLCVLFKFAVNRMKHYGDEAFLKPVSLEEFPSYADFIYQPMDLSTIEKNIRKKMYGSTESFLSDVKWILHNCIIFNGYQHRLTSSAKNIVKVCKFEMSEIEVCPHCYLNSYTNRDNWFCDPCEEPHVLVWAKLKGFPYWPAKAMKVINNNVDVRFFGAHDRAWIPVAQCFLLCRDIPTASKNKKKGSFEQSMEELDLHIQRLTERFGAFQYAPFRTPINPDDLSSHITVFLPQYHGVQRPSLTEYQTKNVVVLNSPNENAESKVESESPVQPGVSDSVLTNGKSEFGESENKIIEIKIPKMSSILKPRAEIMKNLETIHENVKENSTEKSDDEENNKTLEKNEKEDESKNEKEEKSEGIESCEVSSTTNAIDSTNVAKKSTNTDESYKSKLTLEQISEETTGQPEQSSDEEQTVKENPNQEQTLSPKDKKDVEESSTVRNEDDVKKKEKDTPAADLDMECSDEGDLIIDLNRESTDDSDVVEKPKMPSPRIKWKETETKPRRTRSRSAISEGANSSGQKGAVTVINVSSSPPRTVPVLQPRPLVSGKGVAAPSSPGPGCDMNKYSRKMMDFMRGTVEEMFQDMAKSGNLEATVKTLQLEIEKLQWRHQQELAEIKHNTDLVLLEMRASLESEKQRAVAEVRQQCELEKQKAIEETKQKQWCASCGKEAIFYCCWNTSYCDYPCQQAHWPQHMSTCAQSQGGSENDTPSIIANVTDVSNNNKIISSASLSNQVQRAVQGTSDTGLANNRREETHESWARKGQQEDANVCTKRQQEEQRDKRLQMQIQSQNNPMSGQYSNALGPVQYIPSNAVQVIPQTSSLANSSALQVQYATTIQSHSLPMSNSVPTTASSFTPLTSTSAFSMQQTLTNQTPNHRQIQRSHQVTNPMYPIVIQPGSQLGINQSNSSSPSGSNHAYPRGPYIPGKPYHMS